MTHQPANRPCIAEILRHQRLELIPLEQLRPHPSNPRTHSKAQVREIAAQIREFGWTNPVIRDDRGHIVAGHGRVEAARLLGLAEVPTILVSDLSDAQILVLMLADNKIGENSGWSEQALVLNFKELELAGLDLSLTGFSMPEIDQVLGGSTLEADPKANAVPESGSEGPPISRMGDTWILGRHRVHCGDATDHAAYASLMQRSNAQLVVSDPPYNVVIDGHAGGLGKVRHREFAMASGEMTETQYVGFLRAVMQQLKDHSVDGSLHYLFIDWAHIYELLSAARGIFADLKNICVWNKSNGGMGSLYRSKHELVAIFKSGRASHVNNIELGRHGRYRTNVWDYAGVNSFGTARSEELAMHPTVKPVELIADAILDASHRGGIVLDPFAGSGTIIIAAERVGRRAFAMEIDPHYVDTTIRRFQVYSGEDAVHEASGLTFAAVARQAIEQPIGKRSPGKRPPSKSTRRAKGER